MYTSTNAAMNRTSTPFPPTFSICMLRSVHDDRLKLLSPSHAGKSPHRRRPCRLTAVRIPLSALLTFSLVPLALASQNPRARPMVSGRAPRPMAIDDVINLRSLEGRTPIRISSDGRLVAYVVYDPRRIGAPGDAGVFGMTKSGVRSG